MVRHIAGPAVKMAAVAIVASGAALCTVPGASASSQVRGDRVALGWNDPNPSVVKRGVSASAASRGHRNQNYSSVNSATVQRGLHLKYQTLMQKSSIQEGDCRRGDSCHIAQQPRH
ncbi:hypothetical protein Misp01_45790 [Microtetraspora sp. NBRC 13810]|uniref:hypothetical protein n=1 Tax=Microtetraspora sp. NBRC 13810 TaxID=3030990 RepID=UPI0024A15CB5|nr:hypothetical protein [Microtetraspora sp. NBRC 13810]GLW09450.1 hypothetical protein Misp01_45790 [Microtetraspora sp. NBRC 13810]